MLGSSRKADSFIESIGLVSFKELLPTKKEAQTGKNYLTENEMYRMYLLSEQFLLFAESSALMGKELTMTKLHNQLDNLLKLNGYPVFDGYKDFIKDEALEHAEREYNRYVDLRKLEMLGIEVDSTDYDIGEYSEYSEAMQSISMQKLKKHFKERNEKAIEAKPSNIKSLNASLVTTLNYNPKG